jgi:hypothetical protein
MSHQYFNKSKSQLTSLTPAQLPAVAVSTRQIVYIYIYIYIMIINSTPKVWCCDQCRDKESIVNTEDRLRDFTNVATLKKYL